MKEEPGYITLYASDRQIDGCVYYPELLTWSAYYSVRDRLIAAANRPPAVSRFDVTYRVLKLQALRAAAVRIRCARDLLRWAGIRGEV